MFDHDLLRTFVRIVDAGSFSAASAAVGRSLSAVSMQMKRLEELAGRRLLIRSARGVRLTPEGELLLVHARQILEAHDLAFDALMNARASRSLTVGLPDTYLNRLVVPLIGRLACRFPDTSLRILTEPSTVVARRVEEGAVDVGLITELQVSDRGGELIHVERGLWAGVDGAPAVTAAPVPLALSPEGYFRRLAQEVLRQASKPYVVAVTSNNEWAIQGAIGSGAVVGLLPESKLLAGRMRELTPEEGFPAVPDLRVRMRLGRRLPPAGEWLAAALVQQARERGFGAEG